MTDEKIKNSNELEFAVFCIENVAAKLGVNAARVYQAFTEKSDILNGYIVPEYEMLHTQSREYIVDDLFGKIILTIPEGIFFKRIFDSPFFTEPCVRGCCVPVARV